MHRQRGQRQTGTGRDRDRLRTREKEKKKDESHVEVEGRERQREREKSVPQQARDIQITCINGSQVVACPGEPAANGFQRLYSITSCSTLETIAKLYSGEK